MLEIGDSDALEVGDFVLAIGNPFGVGQTVTQGIVSALARTQIGINDYGFFIQTDAAINPGNSGGALVDLDGRLVGINSAIFSRSGGSVGIGFAIPVNMVKSVVCGGRERRQAVRRPWLGAGLQNVTKDIANSLGLDRPAGALVVSDPRRARRQAGLKRGDAITAVDGQEVDDAEGVGFRLGVKPLGGSADDRDRCAPDANSTRNFSSPRRRKRRRATRSASRAARRSKGALVDERFARGHGGAVADLDNDETPKGVVVADVAANLARRQFRRAEGRPGRRGQRRKIATTRTSTPPAGARPLLGSDHRARRRSDPLAHRRLAARRHAALTAGLPLPHDRRRFSEAHSARISLAAAPLGLISVTPRPWRAAS